MQPTLVENPAMTAADVSPAAASRGVIPEYSIHLDAVRGAAATVVFLGHLRLFFLPSISKVVEFEMGKRPAAVAASTAHPGHRGGGGSLDMAHEAVMIFFVLSGYLVGGGVIRALKQGRWSWKRYLIHRMTRLWMVLIPVLLLGFAIDVAGTHHFSGQPTVYTVGPGGIQWEPLLPQRIGLPVLLGNMAFLQGIFVPPSGTNQPLWSLANEFWYYLAFPCLLLGFVGRQAIWKRALALAAAGAILWFAGGKISLYFVIWLIGASAAVLPLKIPRPYQKICACFALVLFPVVKLVAKAVAFESFFVDLAVALVFLAFLYCVLHLTDAAKMGMYGHGSRFISKISYSLYLVHAPVLCILSAILVGSSQVQPLNWHTALLLCEVAGVVLAVTCAVHYLFEAQTDRVRRFLEARL